MNTGSFRRAVWALFSHMTVLGEGSSEGGIHTQPTGKLGVQRSLKICSIAGLVIQIKSAASCTSCLK